MKEPKTNIAIIINGCLEQRASSQKRLFQMYYSYVFSFCIRYATSEDEAKEMLNDTFFTVFKFIERYDSLYPFKPWLRKLCINCCLQYNRKYFNKKTEFPLNDNDLRHEDEFYELPEIEELDYLNLLSDLSPAYKTVVNLFVVEEYKHHEIAEMLGISVGTSKSNLSRAKKILMQTLDRDSRGHIKRKTGSNE